MLEKSMTILWWTGNLKKETANTLRFYIVPRLFRYF
jgi:hypothetical protein